MIDSRKIAQKCARLIADWFTGGLEVEELV